MISSSDTSAIAGDTSAIDEKVAKLNSSSGKGEIYSNIKGFFAFLFAIIIFIGMYFSSSGLILYLCKLAQSNILPTDIHCKPYEATPPNIQPIETNIFTTNTDPPLSMKMNFPYDKYNSSNKVLDMIYQYKNQSDSNFLGNYFLSIIESLLHINYLIFNKILNTFNENLSEYAIVMFSPILAGIILSIIFFYDHLYLIYLWFSNMSWFFKKNTNETGKGQPKWNDVTIASFTDYGVGICLVMLFIFIFFVGFPILSIIIFVTMVWCVFSCRAYKASMGGKIINVEPIIQDVFKYYKISIMSFFSFLVIVIAFSKLGTTPGIFSVITLLMIYYGIIRIDMFNPIAQNNLSKVVSYDQAKKTCDFKPVEKEKHGLLSSLIFGNNQSGGGNITKQLKKISKTITKNN